MEARERSTFQVAQITATSPLSMITKDVHPIDQLAFSHISILLSLLTLSQDILLNYRLLLLSSPNLQLIEGKLRNHRVLCSLTQTAQEIHSKAEIW